MTFASTTVTTAGELFKYTGREFSHIATGMTTAATTAAARAGRVSRGQKRLTDGTSSQARSQSCRSAGVSAGTADNSPTRFSRSLIAMAQRGQRAACLRGRHGPKTPRVTSAGRTLSHFMAAASEVVPDRRFAGS